MTLAIEIVEDAKNTIEINTTTTYLDVQETNGTFVTAVSSGHTIDITETTANTITGVTVNSIVSVSEVQSNTIVVSTAFGDVQGPSSSTDNAIVRWNESSGKFIQNSVVTVDDITGVMKGVTELWFNASGSCKLVLNGTTFEVWVQGQIVESWG